MAGRHLTIIQTHGEGDEAPEVETFSIRPGPISALFSVLLGLITLALAFFIVAPLIVMALLLVGAWLALTWARSLSARLLGRAARGGRRNVRIVGPGHGS